ncbi:hypothetical protein COU60_03075 [Candidatus Pacearchaeota archaeon CG10_big_fil_rev_8_21_14_0_10_34_76]|nr:MAG: hypothetical protein COU60_03075 [Candidatus Pacearchaeota archaeon CG10_big_fil_rev_8_21_14_0_10_34_76]
MNNKIVKDMFVKAIIVLAILSAVILLIGPTITGNFLGIFPEKNSGQGTAWATEDVSYEQLPGYIERSQFMESFPSEGKALLIVGEEKFTIKKGSVIRGDIQYPDMIIRFPEKYLDTLGKRGLCNTVREAEDKGDLAIQLQASELELAWKYKGMFKYKNCLGF